MFRQNGTVAERPRGVILQTDEHLFSALHTKEQER